MRLPTDGTGVSPGSGRLSGSRSRSPRVTGSVGELPGVVVIFSEGAVADQRSSALTDLRPSVFVTDIHSDIGRGRTLGNSVTAGTQRPCTSRRARDTSVIKSRVLEHLARA